GRPSAAKSVSAEAVATEGSLEDSRRLACDPEGLRTPHSLVTDAGHLGAQSSRGFAVGANPLPIGTDIGAFVLSAAPHGRWTGRSGESGGSLQLVSQRRPQALEHRLVNQLFELDSGELAFDPANGRGLEAEAGKPHQDSIPGLGRPGATTHEAADRGEVEHIQLDFHARLRTTGRLHR